MDESDGSSTVTDYSDNDNTGTVASTSDVKFTGSAAKFTGEESSTNKITVSDVDSRDNVDELTMAIDYKFTDPTYNNKRKDLAEQNMASGTLALITAQHGGGSHKILTRAPTDEDRLWAGETFDNDKRHTLIVTLDDNGHTVYVDGEKHNSQDATNLGFGLEELTIGTDPSLSRQTFIGKIYEFRMYYAAFDESEVQGLFNSMGD
jgi:hypothetical protein